MVTEIYINRIKEILQKHLNSNEKVFVFGSSVENEKFGDVDLAVFSEQAVDETKLRHIREDLEESTLPYKFDLVDINQTNDPFRTRVLNGPKIWII
ncbi:MAG: nucleotidyltransferase domain-containing protein [bacterium]